MMYDIYHRLALAEQGPVLGAAEALRYASQNGKKNFLYTHSDGFPRLLLEKWGLLDEFTFITAHSISLPNPPPTR